MVRFGKAPGGARIVWLIVLFVGALHVSIRPSAKLGEFAALLVKVSSVGSGFVQAANPEEESLKKSLTDESESNKIQLVNGPGIVPPKDDPKIAVLDDETYFRFIKDNPSILVLYYAEWCHWCREYIPKYREASKILQAQDLPVITAVVDISNNHKVADAENIKEFPVTRLILDGIPHGYTGPREAVGLVKWVKEKLGVGMLMADASRFDGFVSSHKGVSFILGWFGGSQESSEQTEATIKACEAVSRLLEYTLFLHIASFSLVEDLISNYNAPPTIRDSTKNFILLINTHEGEVHGKSSPTTGNRRQNRETVLFDGNMASIDEIKEFITTHRFREVEPYTDYTAIKAISDGRPSFIVVTSRNDSENPAVMDRLTESMHTAAKQFRSRMIFFHCFEETSIPHRLFHFLGLLGEPTPSARIFLANPHGHSIWYSVLKYRPPPNVLVSPKELVQYIESYFAGKLEPWVRSEDPPTAEDLQGPILPLVASQFQKLVYDDDQRTVVVEFYTRWCGHCKQLEPVYRGVGKLLLPYPEFVLYCLDADRNEVPEMIPGYPTILLYSRTTRDEKGRKMSYSYYGERNLESLLAWILQHGNSQLSPMKLLADAAAKKDSGVPPKSPDEEL